MIIHSSIISYLNSILFPIFCESFSISGDADITPAAISSVILIRSMGNWFVFLLLIRTFFNMAQVAKNLAFRQFIISNTSGSLPNLGYSVLFCRRIYVVNFKIIPSFAVGTRTVFGDPLRSS